jgi:hypothetical protein
MATISSLAESPKRIKRLFNRYDIGLGIYEVILLINGRPSAVLLDDYIPTFANMPIFSKPKEDTE